MIDNEEKKLQKKLSTDTFDEEKERNIEDQVLNHNMNAIQEPGTATTVDLSRQPKMTINLKGKINSTSC